MRKAVEALVAPEAGGLFAEPPPELVLEALRALAAIGRGKSEWWPEFGP